MKKISIVVVLFILGAVPLFGQTFNDKNEKPPLDTNSFRSWADVGEGAISPDGNYVSYHIYNQPPGSYKLVIQSVNGDWKKEYEEASSEHFSDDSRTITFKTSGDSLYALELGTNNLNYVNDVAENRPSKEASNNNNEKLDEAIKLLHNSSLVIGEGLSESARKPQFSEDGNLVLFTMQKKETEKPKPNAVQVDIWSYRDVQLQSRQLAGVKQPVIYTVVVNLKEQKVFLVTKDNESITARNENVALVKQEPGQFAFFEAYWNKAAQASYWLVSFKDGSRKLIRDHLVSQMEGVGLSSAGKWLLYYDVAQKDFFSYEIATGIRRNITKGIAESWLDKDNDRPEPALRWVPWRNTWLKDDEAVLINDNYDIWMIDPSCRKPPVNLTNGYGRRHHTTFELINKDAALQRISADSKVTLVLSAVNEDNKNRGFYTKRLDMKGDPKLGIMGPYVFGDWAGHGEFNYPPLKADSSDTWMVKRMSAIESPDYFVTKDFKHFSRITNVQPQKAYNWMTTELVHWKNFDGSRSTGILYKPENFDPHKKYPVIFHYYEIKSDELNLYIGTSPAKSNINIAWYVSNGYLVFVPDIHYEIGEPGQSVYNAVVSAARYLLTKPWVDPKRMGLQGHSWGGYETNFIVTHSNLFAAACSASGISDFISWYGDVTSFANPKYNLERQQGRMGGTPWQMREKYIQNSPIFYADKVSTPLLMMSNKEDNQVAFAQGVEFFTALRRLGKKVWMLQYDGEGHTLDFRGKVPEDYTIRMAQFFDHYLKGIPTPKWMVEGIPAKMKGIDDGLELEPPGVEPRPGLNATEPINNNQILNEKANQK